jgi:uncharacterized protein (DUF433 family)
MNPLHSPAMPPVHKHQRPRATAAKVRAMLSLREATVLADVAEAKVRKDIETGLLAPIKSANLERLLFRWADVFVFAAVYKGDLLSAALRKKAFAELEGLTAPSSRRHFYDHLDAAALLAATLTRDRPSQLFGAGDRLQLDDYLFIDIAKVVEDLAARVDLYAKGLTHIEQKEGVLGGEAVFKNTRLSVNHIGKMREGGEPIADIIEDYPYLRPDDVEFARLYFKAHPVLGRPPRREESGVAGHPSPR